MYYYLVKFCCICLNKKSKYLSLNNFDYDKINLLDKLKYCGFIHDDIIHDTPLYICRQCYHNLNTAYTLRKLCIRNSTLLSRYVSLLKGIHSKKYGKSYVCLSKLDRNKCTNNNVAIVDECYNNHRSLEQVQQVDSHSLTSNLNIQSVDTNVILCEPIVDTVSVVDNSVDLDNTPLSVVKERLSLSPATVKQTDNITTATASSSNNDTVFGPDESGADDIVTVEDSILQLPQDEQIYSNLKTEFLTSCTLPAYKQEVDNSDSDQDTIPLEGFDDVGNSLLHTLDNTHDNNNAERLPNCSSTCSRLNLKGEAAVTLDTDNFYSDISSASSLLDVKPPLIDSDAETIKFVEQNGEDDVFSDISSARFSGDSEPGQAQGTVVDTEVFSCHVCKAVFSKKMLLTWHLKIHESESGSVALSTSEPVVYKCHICGADFMKSMLLKWHLKLHQERSKAAQSEKEIKCGECGAQFEKRVELTWHLKTHVGVEGVERPFECGVCGRRYAQRKTLRLHERTHAADGRRFACGACPSRFYTRWRLRAHERRHSGERPHACAVCGRRFSDRSSMRRHAARHAAAPVRRHHCAECNKSFTLRSVLRTHQALHSGLRPHQCAVCGKAYPVRGYLTRHMLTHSADPPRHACPLCPKTFTSGFALRQHRLIHEGAKNYACSLCDKAFTLPNYLRMHMKRHTDDKRHECNLCGARFIQSSHLKRHSAVHTKIRPFTCTYCYKKFSRKENVTKHVAKFHNNKTPE